MNESKKTKATRPVPNPFDEIARQMRRANTPGHDEQNTAQMGCLIGAIEQLAEIVQRQQEEIHQLRQDLLSHLHLTP